ncbi:MAG: phenylalanine--tRNA ligase beta subunit-related protein [Candidatus Saccharibacteria bacterium]
MGGRDSEVDENTKTIVLEAATFDMYDIRRTSMELGLFSEAVTRFTKGQSPLQTLRILGYAISRLTELAPGSKVASAVVDDVHLPEATIKRDSIHPAITVSADFINKRLGTTLSEGEITSLLQNVECQVEINTNELSVTAPFWRTDLEIREDVVEEVGRLYGFENIKPVLLEGQVRAVTKNKDLESKSDVRHLLASAGANELLTYSFISKKLVEGANQSVDSAFEIANSISPELNYYRVSVLPSLLSKVQMNIKAGFDEFALFELGTYHIYGIYKEDEPELPAEFPSLALVYAARHPGSSAAYFKAKNLLVYLLDELNLVDVKFVPLSSVKDIADNLSELAKPFDINRSALVVSGDKQWGVVGEFSRDTLAKLKLPKYSAGFEVDSRLFLDSHRDEVYKQISRFPSVKQDITLKVAGESNYSAIYSYLVEQLSGLAAKTSSYSLTPTSIFSPEGSDGSRNYTFHLVIADDERTLKDQEVNELLDKLAALAKDKLGAVRV